MQQPDEPKSAPQPFDTFQHITVDASESDEKASGDTTTVDTTTVDTTNELEQTEMKALKIISDGKTRL